MAAVIPVDPAAILAGPYTPLALLVIAAWGLANCFLGYPLFRVVLTIHGATAGWALGVALAQWLRPTPTSVDYLIACASLVVLVGMAGWFADRSVFTVGVFWLVMVTVARLPGEPTAWSWIVGGLIGAGAGVAARRYLRNAIILITGAAGATAAVLAGAVLFTAGSGWQDLVETMFGRQQPWLAWVLAILIVATATGGIIGQMRLADAVSDIFMPPHPGRQRTARQRGARVFPKFTKV